MPGVLYFIFASSFSFSIPVSFHTNTKNISLCKVAVVSLLPRDTSYTRGAQLVEVLSLWFLWSSGTKINTYPYVITLYLAIGASCAIPSEGISHSFL